MILLKLFLTFFYIGITTFGGGYAMIPLVRDQVLSNNWLTDDEFLNMIAVAEATPGPVAVNMATFIGSDQAGLLGSALATLGVVLPSFIIILLISSVIKNFLKFKAVNAFLEGVRPVVVGLITATAITMLLSTILGITTFSEGFALDIPSLIIFGIIVCIALLWKKLRKKKPSPIMMILISAVLGMIIIPLF